MFLRLTVGQATMIQEIHRRLTVSEAQAVQKSNRVVFLGLDQNELPVVQFTDRRRTTEPFAIPRSTHRRGAVEPALPLRWFTDEELDHLSSLDVEILMGLCMAQAPSSSG